MAFDPTKPFSIVEDGKAQSSGFDPNQPFEIVAAKPQRQVPASEAAMNMASDIAIEGGISTGGQLVGGLTGPGYLVIAPAAGYYGNYLKQKQQIERGERKTFSEGEAFAAALINLIPAANTLKVYAKAGIDLAAKPIGTQLAATAGLRAVEGAGLGALSKTAEQIAEEGRFPTKEEYANALLAGGALGAVVGGAEASIRAVAPKLSPGASKMWDRFAGKKASEVGPQLDNLAANGTETEKAAAREIVDIINQQLGISGQPAPKSAAESAAVMGVLPVKSAREAAALLEQAPITPLTKAEADRPLIQMGLKQEGAAPSALESAAAMGVLPVKPARESAAILEQAPLTADEQAARFVAALEPKSASESAAIMAGGVAPKPARESAAVLIEELQKQEARRAVLSSQFEQARAEQLEQLLKTKGISGPEQTTFDIETSPAKASMDVLDTRPGQAVRERARLEKALDPDELARLERARGGETPKLPTEEQVLQGVENIPGVGGRAGAKKKGLTGGLVSQDVGIPTARGVVAAAIGATQGETPEERLQNAMLGFRAATLNSSGLIRLGIKKASAKANTVEEAIADVQGVKPVAVAKGAESTVASETNPAVKKAIGELNIPEAPRKKTLADVDRLFEEPKEGPKFLTISDRLVELFQNSFRPLAVLEGKVRGKIPDFNLADKFSLLSGAGAKAEPAIRAMETVRQQLVDDIHPKDVNRYFTLMRAANRLQRGILTENLSLEDTSRLLTDLRTNLGADKIGRLEQFGKYMQDAADADLKMMVSSGRMSQELYDEIKAKNDFYAPFHFTNRIGQLDNAVQRGRSGAAIDTQAELAKELSGFDSQDLKLGDIFTAFKRNKYNAHILAEKSAAMKELVNLGYADKDSQFIKFIKKPKDAPEGFESVSYLENGKTKYLAVDASVARAVSNLSPIELGALGKFLQVGAAGLRSGATFLNTGWLTINFPLDVVRQSTISKYGFRSLKDLNPWSGYSTDFLSGLSSAIQYHLPGRFSKANELYQTYLESGAARSNFQSIINEDAFTKAVLRGDDGFVAKAIDVNDKYILSSFGKIASILEDTVKLMGLKRGLRFENWKDVAPEKRAEIMQRIAYETRNYAGSPDMQKTGSLGRQLNLLLMFANTRAQGIAADAAMLAGRTGSKEANRARLAAAVAFGLPTAALWSYNRLPENKEDYDKLSERDKSMFFNVPLYGADGKPKYNTDKYGRKVRDYARFPKRDIPSLVSNTVDKALDFYETQNPEAVNNWAFTMAESISPIPIGGEDMMERAQSALSGLNPVVRLPFEQTMNWDLFRKKPIIPRDLQEVSPKYQYTETTPEVYKNIAQAIPGTSPLRMESMVQGLTGSALTQFIKKPQEGRNELAANPLLSRYFRSGTIDESANFKLLDTLRNQAADRAFEREMAIDQALTEALKVPKEQRPQVMRQYLSPQVVDDPVFFDTVARLLMDKQLQVTPLERRVRGLQPSERAQYIYEQLKSFKRDDEKRVYVSRLTSIPGMFTDDVAKFVSDFQKLEKRSQTLKR